MTVLVGCTMAAFATSRDELSLSWLKNGEALRENYPEGVRFFAALELDARDLEPFEKVIKRLEELGGTYHTFSYDDGRTAIETSSRLWHICMGRNVVTNYAIDTPDVSHVLYLDGDLLVPDDSIPKLLELEHPLVGGHVPTYCLKGESVAEYPYEWNVQQHWNTAGFLMVERNLFRSLRWRYDGWNGDSDDPTFAKDAKNYFGVDTYVRHDLVGQHWPASIVAIERRWDAETLTVHR